MSTLLVGFGLVALVAIAFGLGRTYEATMRDQVQPEPERPPDWAVEMARSDPQRLINALRREELP